MNFRVAVACSFLIATAPIAGCVAPSPSTPTPLVSEPKNTWSPELEAEFQQRAEAIIRFHAGPNYGNTHQENEKRSYPKAMFDLLAGNRERAIAFLQSEDAQADEHRHTEGIDYYYAFTLKGQIRKYFRFGDDLDPAYKQRMFEGAKKWTERDPAERSHPLYGRGDGTGQDWSIRRRGGWVDRRNTDNLRAMREVAVYLMAEETGNESVRKIYQQKLQRYVWALYHIGMGEWDSEIYHGHTFAAYLNLYDFAKDAEVKALAKAALDWLSAAAALKYYRGGWGGPSKRDYGGSNVVYGSPAARTFSLYFGNAPLPNPNPSLNTLYAITSSYRPPQAVVSLARKQFEKPVEVLATKPMYENWKPGGEDRPGYWETQFFGRHYQMGSIAAAFADGDVQPFKLMAYNSQRGVDVFAANVGGGWVRPGKHAGDRVGQFRNLLIWLRPASPQPFFFQVPKTAKAEIEGERWFFQLERTWLAVYPIALSSYQEVSIPNEKFARIYDREQTLKAIPTAGNYVGFALEVGEAETHGSYDRFKQQVRRKSRLNLSNLEAGRVELRGSQGQTLELAIARGTKLPSLKRNGEPYDGFKNFALYRSISGQSPISLGWKTGRLQVQTSDRAWETHYPAGPLAD